MKKLHATPTVFPNMTTSSSSFLSSFNAAHVSTDVGPYSEVWAACHWPHPHKSDSSPIVAMIGVEPSDCLCPQPSVLCAQNVMWQLLLCVDVTAVVCPWLFNASLTWSRRWKKVRADPQLWVCARGRCVANGDNRVSIGGLGSHGGVVALPCSALLVRSVFPAQQGGLPCFDLNQI